MSSELPELERLLLTAAERHYGHRGRRRRGTHRWRARRVAPVLIAASVSASAIALLAMTVHFPELEITQQPSGGAPASAPRFFGVLHRAGTAGDAVPPAATRKIREDPAVVQLGVRWDEARRATSQEGLTVYVIPAERTICMLTYSERIGAGFGCAPPGEAEAGPLTARIVIGRSTVVAGLMPDSVSSVSVHTDVSESAAVENNAFVVPAGRRSGTLRWKDPSGDKSLALPPSLLDGSPPLSRR